MLDCVADGRVGHGPLHNLVSSAQEIGWTWDFGLHAWSGLGLLGLCNSGWPIPRLEAWLGEVAFDLCKKTRFRGGSLLDTHASHQQLVDSHLRERDKGLVRGILAEPEGNSSHVDFVGWLNNDCHLF